MSPTPPPNWHTIRDHWRTRQGDDGLTIPPSPEPWVFSPGSPKPVTGSLLGTLVAFAVLIVFVIGVCIGYGWREIDRPYPVHVMTFKETQNLQR